MGQEPSTPETGELALGSPVSCLPGVGARRQRHLKRLGIRTVSDLVRHIPMRYERQWAEGGIADLPPLGQVGTARGTIVATRVVSASSRSRKSRFEATLQDHRERLSLVWFNAPSALRRRLHPGLVVRVQGKVSAFGGYAQIVNPQWEALDDPDAEPAKDERLRGVYPATEDLGSQVLEDLISAALPQVLPRMADPLDATFLQERGMPPLAESFRMVHQPQSLEEAARARRRLAYNEFLLLQLGIALNRHANRTVLWAPQLHWAPATDEHIRARFPFDLTDAQASAVRQIADDLQKPQPMNRLLQGDVGAGKTVVALYALLLAVANRAQGALMAPTELLAEQHAQCISSMLEGSSVRIELLTGGQSTSGSRQRARVLERIESGDVDIVIGTQVLLTEAVRFKNLAVVVVDEQHRFGVLQRAALRARAVSEPSPRQGPSSTGGREQVSGGESPPETGGRGGPKHRWPHSLVMTATPIPRTLSLTIFGDLDITTIKQLPPGRTPIKTRVVGQDKADDVYRYVATRVARGQQAYVVVPAIEPAGQESEIELKSVDEHVKLLSERFCQGQSVVGIHGRLKRPERESIMERFRLGKIQVLVATTVIEVGIDVPNATLMVVEHAERFGLAQLHQLRGRIGRGRHPHPCVCVFIAEPTTEDASKRLEAIASTTDGFKIAEADLEIRGIGDFFGTRQHGLPPLRVARIPQDMDLLMLAHQDAARIVQADPGFQAPQHQLLKKILLRQFGDTLSLIGVG